MTVSVGEVSPAERLFNELVSLMKGLFLCLKFLWLKDCFYGYGVSG